MLTSESGCVRGALAAFAEKHRLFTWTHKLIKNRRKTWHFHLHFAPVGFALSHSLLQPP
jgi:hypothetical protein